ncbi:hypothetical protein Tco_0773151 [Tanacetum coccineum]|uniref:Uncharacterized protein n=1 Tax=Tanacetum coccineum TaxID=301880 RepID=A0ABQ4ZKS8_9ASTR
MNPQETQQVAVRDEKWVPSAERVKISSTNILLETTVPQKEETFQVIIDVIKNSTCFKAFTISADVPEIFMQQFWYTIKKVQDSDSYEFLLSNKKCIVNAEVFRTILDICPRVEGEDFTDVPDDETTLTFLLDLGYKGPLNGHTNMFVDHIHQPWRTLAGMFNMENVDYPELIWEDLAYQIDHEEEKRSRREDYQEYRLPIPDVMLTAAIKRSESYQMSIKYLTNQISPKKRRGNKGKKTVEESQETIDVSEESEPKPEPTKKKTKAEEVEVARKVHAIHARIMTESAKKKSSGRSSKSVVIQDTLSAPKSKPATSKAKLKGAPSLTPVEQEDANIMQALKESKKTSRRLSGTRGSNEGTGTIPGVPDESTVISATPSEGTGAKQGVPDKDKDITKEKVIFEWGDEQDSEYSDDDEKDGKDSDADDEGDDHVSNTQDVDDEDVETESNEDDTYKYKIRVRKDKDEEMKDAEVEGSDKGDEEITNAAKEEATNTSEVKDDTKNTELPPSSSSLFVSLGFGDQFLKLSSDSSLVSTVKDSADANVSSLLDIPIQHETPKIQSPSVQKFLVSMIPETTNLPPIPEIVIKTPVTTTDPLPQVTPIISTVQQTTTPIPTPTITTDSPTVTTVVPESNALSAVELRVAKLEKDVSELKTVDHSSEAIVVLQSQVPTVVDSYLDTKVGDVFQKELQKHTADLIHKYSLQHLPELTKKPTPTTEQESEKSPSEILKIKKEQVESQKNPQFTIKSTDKATLEEYDLKSALYQSMHANKSFNKNPANHRLYHALMEVLIEDENALDKGVADTVKDHKRKHDDDEDDDDEDPPARPN